MSEASLRASLAFVKTVSCFSRRSAFLSASALSFSATAVKSSISSSKASAFSWAFSEAGRAASAFSALSILVFNSAGISVLLPDCAASAVKSFDWGFLASSALAVSAWLFNSLATSSNVNSPSSIAFNSAVLPIVSFAFSIALALLSGWILLSLLIASSASVSNLVKAVSIAFLVSAASFLAASSLAMASVKAVAAWVAFCVASFKASVAAVLAASASILALFAVAASAASVLAFSVAVLATVVFSATFVSNSTTFASAVLASASACLISGFVTSILVEVADSSLAWATATPVVAIPIPTRTEATPTLNLRNEYFLCVVIMLILLIF